MLEFEKLKSQVNKILTLEFVDNSTIFWDDEGEVIFFPPVHKSNKNYWISLLNKMLDPTKWEVRYSK